MTIKLIETDSSFLEAVCTEVATHDGRLFFNCPFWYERIGGGRYIQYDFEQLPLEVVDLILNSKK